MNEYNTNKQDVILKEYGRNVQKLVDFVVTVEDREKRSNYARTLVELMRQINPAMRDAQDYSQKLWDDLYIMSGFKLDVDAPYPMPPKDAIGKKPQRLIYNSNTIRYKHYGRNIEMLIEKAGKMENPEEKDAFITYIARLMRSFYTTWNKDNIEDSVIVQHIKEISKGNLNVDPEKIRGDGLFEASSREKERERGERASGGDKNKNFKNKNKRPNDHKRRKTN
ncbi:MAG TPA: DUF4290 domain-containing protein [Cytophagales bacterium]|nr:DUF4290 domain-containing protein [Cytophagales bacterium]